MDVEAWLRRLGLEQYAAAFRDNDVDDKVLPELTSDDLISIGVTSVGHRRKLLSAIAGLSAETPAAAVTAASADAPEPATVTAERRQLTVMFCDLVGSTALSGSLDPEDLSRLIRSYQACVATTIARFDGFIARYVGDGVLIYFGYPQAHEDDAERAVRAALAVIAAIDETPTLRQSARARLGVATGLVVVGEPIGTGDARQQTAIGETPNLAARLQALAEPDTVVIADATRRLIGDLFEYRDLGTVELKGIARPLQAWQVLGPSAVRSRFEALHGSALTRLVGRDEELDLLLRRWARAKSGDGHVVLVSGEPGIGKSRITAAFEERLHTEPHLRLRYFCSPYHQDSALYPYVDQLGRAAGFERDDIPAAKREKLEALLARAALPDEDVAFLADLVSLPASKHHSLPKLSPQRKKERTLKALIHQLEGLARQQPVVAVFEDTQWIDPTSRELLDLAVERVRSLSVLLILTFRPEFQPPWTGQAQVTMLALNRLDRHDRIALVDQIAGGKALPEEVVAQIADRTDGVPLFVEELTKSVLESGAPLVGIPSTLHDSLMARLDRLPSVRAVAQTGAAIGREFSYQLLRAVSRLPEDELRSALDRLVESELVLQRGAPPDAVYRFKHALVQDAAYGSLLRDRRRALHHQVAVALEHDQTGVAAVEPELLAYHFAEAGIADRAIDYHTKAAERAMARFALSEMVSHLRRGIGLLNSLPHSREMRRRELSLQVALGHGLLDQVGSASDQGHAAFLRARELCLELGNTDLLLSVLYGLQVYHFTRAELAIVIRYAEEIKDLCLRTNERVAILIGERIAASAYLLLGRLADARTAYEHLLALYETEKDADLPAARTRDPYVAGCSYLAVCLTLMGYPAQGEATSQRGISHAERLQHASSVVFALRRGCVEAMLRRDVGRVEMLSARLLRASTDSETFLGVTEGHFFHSWALLHDRDDVRECLQRSLDQLYETHTWALLPFLMAAAAELTATGGDQTGARRLLLRARELVDVTGECWCQSEIMRLEAALLAEGPTDRAELLRCALALAREQGSRLWQLRCATDLAELLRNQGEPDRAHEMLAPVYAWFTEGFDTPDLKEARALLDELG
jgi:class 3 adenylate cyclase